MAWAFHSSINTFVAENARLCRTIVADEAEKWHMAFNADIERLKFAYGTLSPAGVALGRESR